jgi:hypothetical protein
VGNAQTSRAHNARVVDYFSDSYEDQAEAVQKAELFLSIYDYICRHAALFSRKDLMEGVDERQFSVDQALLRAVHHLFTVVERPAEIDPKRVLALARAFLWRSAELTHPCSIKLTQWFKAGGGAFSFQVVEGVAV